MFSVCRWLRQTIYDYRLIPILSLKKDGASCHCSKTGSPIEANFPFYFDPDSRGTIQAQTSHGKLACPCRSVYNLLEQEGVLELPGGPSRLWQ